jgi:hypothetical protein
VSEAARDFVDETMESMELATRIKGFHLNRNAAYVATTRCGRRSTTCWRPGPATRWSCAPSDDNATLEQRDRVTIDSIRNHCVRHFPVQQVARATYREILERRAKENSVDFIEGVATAVTPIAFLETVMVTGYQTLVDELTTVSYRDGMKAALKLNEIARKDDCGELASFPRPLCP